MFTNRALVKLIVPLIAEQFLVIFIGLADTMMVTGISEAAVSAVSLVDSVNVLLTQLFSAMSAGGAVVAAQYLGKQEPLNACKAAKQLFYVTFLLACAISVISVTANRALLSLIFGTLTEETLRYCETYFLLSALSYPFLALYNSGAALLRAMGDSRASMFTSLIMNVINVGGNALLIYGCKLEVAGAAIASLVSRGVGAGVMVMLLLDIRHPIHLIHPLKWEWSGSMTKRIFRIGIPNGLENSMFQIGKLLLAGFISTFGESLIAANAITGNICSMGNLPGNAVGLAMIAVIGQCVGAGETKQAKQYTIKLMGSIYVMQGLICAVLLLFTREIVSLFGLSPLGVNASEEALKLTAVMCALFWPVSFALPNALRAAGDAKYTMSVSVASMWLCRIGLSYLICGWLPPEHKLLGIWTAMTLDWVVRGAAFVIRYCRGKWLTKKVV